VSHVLCSVSLLLVSVVLLLGPVCPAAVLPGWALPWAGRGDFGVFDKKAAHPKPALRASCVCGCSLVLSGL
jgi:hypothetical protein